MSYPSIDFSLTTESVSSKHADISSRIQIYELNCPRLKNTCKCELDMLLLLCGLFTCVNANHLQWFLTQKISGVVWINYSLCLNDSRYVWITKEVWSQLIDCLLVFVERLYSLVCLGEQDLFVCIPFSAHDFTIKEYSEYVCVKEFYSSEGLGCYWELELNKLKK